MPTILFTSMPLGEVRSVGFSILILLTLVLVLLGSWAMFRVVARDSTHQRHSVAMREWGRPRGIHLVDLTDDPPPPAPLDAVTTQRLAVRYRLAGKKVVLIQFESFVPAGSFGSGDTRACAGVWNLLIRDIETEWPATGLRPAVATTSALDLFSLTSFPLLGSSERFVIYATETKAAAALSRSAARGLLPKDVGMLLHGRSLVLDFSGRPFDRIEFERMMAVAEQLVGHLPGPSVA